MHQGTSAALLAVLCICWTPQPAAAAGLRQRHHRRLQTTQEQQQQQQQQALPLPSTPASSKDCGTPYALCGLSLPSGVSCPQGPGWCQAGHFCGVSKLSVDPRCLPVPHDCGQEGQPCCPSNTLSPHTQQADVFRQGYCKGGAVCFSWSQLGVVKDFYKGNVGAFPCLTVPADCGQAAGRACCPLLYRLSANPKLPKEGCWGSGAGKGLYCRFNSSALQAGAQLPFIPGTCVENDADCGAFGRSCCVETTGSGNMLRCGPGPSGEKGFCSWGQKGTLMEGKSVCAQCPSSDAIKADSAKYSGCT